jgi:TonB family protein
MADLQDDIEKYCRGELSPAEMHALEKKALSDPFLAEALEGASTIAPDDFSADVASMRQQLSGSETRIIPLWKWVSGIAAGLVIIGLATTALIRQSENPADRIAQNKAESTAKNEPPTEGPANADSVRLELREPTTADTPKSSPPIMKQSDSHLALKEDDQAGVSEEIEKPETGAVAESEAAGRVPSHVGGYVTDSASEPTNSAAPQSAERLANKDKQPLDVMVESIAAAPAKVITGRVLDAEDGRGLPGVNVAVKGAAVGTVTDEEGRYSIPLDSLSNGLLFSFIGYENKEVPADPASLSEVVMNPDIAQLSEVVVIGYGGEKREDTDFNPIVEAPEPAGGRKAFKQYLEKNLKYPDQALNHGIEGRVTVQFTVEPTGKTSDFRILKGLGYGCDEELIRLIQEGPQWRPGRRNTEAVGDKIKVRMKFTLPKK